MRASRAVPRRWVAVAGAAMAASLWGCGAKPGGSAPEATVTASAPIMASPASEVISADAYVGAPREREQAKGSARGPASDRSRAEA